VVVFPQVGTHKNISLLFFVTVGEHFIFHLERCIAIEIEVRPFLSRHLLERGSRAVIDFN
jgi:hypothetical protein